jgi:non-ribosomal peptide synthetase component F
MATDEFNITVIALVALGTPVADDLAAAAHAWFDLHATEGEWHLLGAEVDARAQRLHQLLAELDAPRSRVTAPLLARSRSPELVCERCCP